MSSQASANALAERVRANVAELMAEFDTLSRAAHGQAGEVLTFSRRLDDYVMRFGSMRRTRVAGHILAGMRADDHRGLTALGHACAALELFHASALIHDDIIDDSPVRRNHPAFHIGWDEVAETTTVTPTAGAAPPAEPSSVVSLPLGVAAGLLGGDVLLVLCARSIDRIDGPLRRRISGFFQEAQLRTVIGEFQDSLLEHRRTSVDRASVRAMSVNKTAWYTVIAPLILAARCAEADEDRIPPLLEAGAAYGEAFQLLDDLNEVVLDPAITGKNALDDLRTGKATLLRQILETAATPAERRILAEVYGRPDGTERELARYRNVVEVHREHITGELLALLDRARAALVAAGLDDRTVRAVEREIDPHDTFPISLDESA
ncbi:MAG TPA: polyprenyl synthetase family protein [Nocardia sp.]|uniref:polyprenyl synthetase family protein n=1 Tax=Nocardia TaxID=1817 RepID=UPI0024538771|nr:MULTISPECIES: polyprenyl synthetase family protein [Nocardia]HLS77746.1 polyprenyl synthetase family protein [Nocardia sp.]